MKMSENTVLITGGTSGIGLELAKRFIELNNTVIVTGRDAAKLAETKQQHAKIHTLQSDAGDPAAIAALFAQVKQTFPALNILVNNAGIMRKINLQTTGDNLADITREIDINLAGPLRMVQQFLPLLKAQNSAAIVNVTSGLAFVPLPISPVYSATKAALHSYTQSLRIQLQKTSVKVFELAPPGTETPLLRGDFTDEDLGGVKGMEVGILGKHTMAGLANDVYEIRPGMSNALKMMSRVAPAFILKQLGKSAEKMATH